MRKELALAVFLAVVTPAFAQEQAAEDGSDVITVTGNRDIRSTVKEFVEALSPGRVARPMNRFEREICPLVLGLSKPQADAVAARMRLVAREAGMRIGQAGCGPNLFLLVTTDKRKMLDEMRRVNNEAFGSLSSDRISGLYRQPGAAIVWHSQGPPIGRDGKEATFLSSGGAADNPSYYLNRTTEAGSRLNIGGGAQFASATVVVERRALQGLTVTQLADYVALRAFTGADPARLKSGKVPTILHVLDAFPDTVVPLSMTALDLAFLGGFYGRGIGLSPSQQRSAISRQVEREVTKGSQPTRPE